MARKLDTSIRGRRERLVRYFGKREIEAAVLDHLRCHGLDILTDEALKAVATNLVADMRFSRKLAAENRAIYAARQSFKIAAE